MLIVLLISF